jgi:hypothetical protein
MKRLAALLFVGILSLSSCDLLLNGLSDEEIAQGLKEALKVGTDTSVAETNRLNGYFMNQAIKIMLPPEAQVIQSSVAFIPGGQSLIDEVVLKMNRAAEHAAAEATPIFVNAIISITFDDARQILSGGQRAATDYLDSRTRNQLYTSFKPVIEDALEFVGIQTAWGTLVNGYNSIPLVQPVNPDLADHTTTKGLDGLFHIIALEEAKIRTDINHRVNDLLRRVFENI